MINNIEYIDSKSIIRSNNILDDVCHSGNSESIISTAVIVQFNNESTENAHVMKQTTVKGIWEERLNPTVLSNGGFGQCKVSHTAVSHACLCRVRKVLHYMHAWVYHVRHCVDYAVSSCY